MRIVDSLIGQTIGNYQIVRSIGKGGMGEVYLGEHPEIGQKVAVKLLAPAFSTRPDTAQRFLVEARLLVQLNHPNIVRIHDFGKTDTGQLYYIMEHLEGRSLGDQLDNSGTVPLAEAGDFLEQICDALQAAHDHDVVHRDLKPDNIFIIREAGKQRVKILDFGIAKILQGDGSIGATQTGQVLGSPLFISPEQALGLPDHIGPWTDVYALGVILFTLLSGEPPFYDEAPGRLLAMHMDATPPRLQDFAPHLPEGVCQVVNSCLAKEPEHRPESAAELARAFKAGMEGGNPGLKTPEPVQFDLDLNTDTKDLHPQSGLREVDLELDSKDESLRLDSSAQRATAYASTTMSGSVGQVTPQPEKKPPRSIRGHLGLMLTGVLILLLGGGIFLSTRGTEELEQTLPAGTAAPPPTENPLPVEIFSVRVVTPDQGLLCRFGIAGKEMRVMTAPCTIKVPRGQELKLEIRKGAQIIKQETWLVEQDRVITLDALRPPTPAAAAPPPAVKESEPVGEGLAPSRKEPAAKKKAAPRKRKPRSKPAEPEKKPQEVLGEGVLDDF